METASRKYITRHPVIGDDPTRVLNLHEYGHVPSWKVKGDGTATFEVCAHIKAKWVSVWMMEKLNGGKCRRTAYTLDEAEARALRDLLNEVLGYKEPKCE